MEFKRYARIVLEEIALLVLMSALGAYIGTIAQASTSFQPPFYPTPALWLLVFHALLGLVIVGVAALLFSDFMQVKDNKMVIYSTAGLVSLLIAYISGLLFVLGGATFVFSILMVGGFVVALVAYLLLLMELKHHR